MARSHNNGITILLGVKDVNKASMEKKEKNAHTVDQKSSISMEKVEPGKFSIAGVEEKEFIWNSSTANGNVRVVPWKDLDQLDILLPP